MPLNKIGPKPLVWIIDWEQWPRANLRALLLDRGFDAVGFEEIDAALAALKDLHRSKPCIIILELHSLSPSEEELDALARLSIPIVGLAGAVELSQPWVREFNWAVLTKRPITIGQIADTVVKLMTDRATRPV
jgi:FixJ family two-component response regulator